MKQYQLVVQSGEQFDNPDPFYIFRLNFEIPEGQGGAVGATDSNGNSSEPYTDLIPMIDGDIEGFAGAIGDWIKSKLSSGDLPEPFVTQVAVVSEEVSTDLLA